MSKAIAPHLPYLRRFARALAGTQAAGDAYVAATLEVLIEDPSLFDDSLDPRVALYRTFLGLWNSVDINLKPEGPAGAATAIDRKLEVHHAAARARPSCSARWRVSRRRSGADPRRRRRRSSTS